MMNARLLGIMLMVGSVAVALNSFRSDYSFDLVSSIAMLLWCIGGICGLIGLLRLNALGQNPVARTAAFLPIFGFATIVVSDTLRIAGIIPLGTPVNNALAAIGWVAILAGMLVVSILTVAARTWTGWRRFVPLLTVILIPLAFGLGSLTGETRMSGALAYVGYILLGYVIATADPVPHLQTAVTA